MAGILSDKWGRKLVMILSALLFSASGIWCTIASDFVHLVWARILGGVAIGIVSIVSPLYISEVAATQYRGRLVSLYQVAVTIGFLSAYIVNYYLLLYSQSNPLLETPILQYIMVSEVWRGMLGMESVPALLFLLVIFFIPESPRWLIVSHKKEKAKGILFRIYRSVQTVEEHIGMTESVLKTESKNSDWSVLSQPGILKAVIIGVCIAILGQFMGVNAVLYYGPSIFENAGLSGGDSLYYQVLVGLVNTLTSIFALLIIPQIRN